jgi:hypothetical protein
VRWDQGRTPCSPTARAWCTSRPQRLENRRWSRRLPYRGGVRSCPPGRRTTPRFQVNENRVKRGRQVDREGGLSHPSLPLDHRENCHGAYSTASGPRAARTGRARCAGRAAGAATTVCAGATVRTGSTVGCRSMQFPSRPRARGRTSESGRAVATTSPPYPTPKRWAETWQMFRQRARLATADTRLGRVSCWRAATP